MNSPTQGKGTSNIRPVQAEQNQDWINQCSFKHFVVESNNSLLVEAFPSMPLKCNAARDWMIEQCHGLYLQLHPPLLPHLLDTVDNWKSIAPIAHIACHWYVLPQKKGKRSLVGHGWPVVSVCNTSFVHDLIFICYCSHTQCNGSQVSWTLK